MTQLDLLSFRPSVQADDPPSTDADLIEALSAMCGRDGDMAREENGIGFNKLDTGVMHDIYLFFRSRGYLTYKQQALVRKTLRKYKGQIVQILGEERATRLLTDTARSDPPTGAAAHAAHARASRVAGTITLTAEGTVEIKFDYDRQLVDTVKALPMRWYNSPTKSWFVPESQLTAVVQAFPQFTLNEAAQAALKTPADNPEGVIGEIDLVGQSVTIRFPYDEDLIDRAHDIPGAHWDAALRCWTAPSSEFETALDRFPEFSLGSRAAQRAAKIAQEREAAADRQRVLEADSERRLAALRAATGNLTAPLPGGIILFQHQREGVEWLIRTRRNILADDMGLGKTLQALVAARAFEDCEIVVICPVTLQDNWRAEARIAGVPLSIYSNSAQKIPPPPNWNYIVIADEAHAFQNWDSQRTQKFMTLAQDDRCQAVFMLTGTPIKNGRPANLFPLLRAAGHPIATNRSKFERHFCAAHNNGYGWNTMGAAHLEELRDKTKTMLLRRTKAECLDLPDKIRVLRDAEVSRDAFRAYEAKLKELQERYEQRKRDGVIIGGNEAMVMLGHLRQAASIAKVETSLELAQEALEEGRQVVLFVTFKETARLLSEALGNCPILSGDTSQQDRQPMVKAFQTGEHKVLVCLFGAGGVGITLHKADIVILVDRPWTPGDAVQAEDRLHRIGQKSVVTAVWVQAFEVDEQIDALLLDKQKNIDLVLAGKDTGQLGVDAVAQSAHDIALQVLPRLLGKV